MSTHHCDERKSVYISGKRNECQTFVGRIPKEMSSQQLIDVFSREDLPQIVDAIIIKEKDGTSKGFGFLQYKTQDDAKMVEQMGHMPTYVNGKEIRLNLGPAVRKEHPDQSGIKVQLMPRITDKKEPTYGTSEFYRNPKSQVNVFEASPIQRNAVMFQEY